jgi:hypothetical protein
MPRFPRKGKGRKARKGKGDATLSGAFQGWRWYLHSATQGCGSLRPGLFTSAPFRAKNRLRSSSPLATPGAPGLARRFNPHDHLPLLVLSAHVRVAANAKPMKQPTGGPAGSSVSRIVDTTPDGIRMSASGNATPRFAGGTVFVEHGFLLQPMVLGCRCECEGACNLAQLRAK